MKNPPAPLYESQLQSLQLLARGKVRDIYEVDAGHLLIVATDRISAFDVVLPDPIPGKGIVLTAISNFWFQRLEHVIPNHLCDLAPSDILASEADVDALAERAVVVERLQPLPLEAVVRGYLIGSGWKDYCASGQICGVSLPEGMEIAEKLPEPIFTPSTKASPGSHDENVSMQQIENFIGTELAQRVQNVSLQLYSEAAEYASARDIIIADTKFEFGLDAMGKLKLIDELFTPDSSRFWPRASYAPGSSPQSFDKQYVRDYLETLDWDKRAPGPELPAVVIERTRQKYCDALLKLTR